MESESQPGSLAIGHSMVTFSYLVNYYIAVLDSHGICFFFFSFLTIISILSFITSDSYQIHITLQSIRSLPRLLTIPTSLTRTLKSQIYLNIFTMFNVPNRQPTQNKTSSMSSSTSNPPKKDWVHKLAGAYQTHDMIAYTTPSQPRTDSQQHRSNSNNGPTSHPKQYEPSVTSMSTTYSEKPLVSEKKSSRSQLKKLFS